MEQTAWGFHLSLDLYDVNREIITSEKLLKQFLIDITDFIKMHRFGEPQVYKFGSGKLEGWSGVQLIEESCISFHCDEQNGNNTIYIDLFSCCKYNVEKTIIYLIEYFNAKKVNPLYRER